MPKFAYENWKPGQEAQEMALRARRICEDYASQGYDLTLRQLYYQFVARGLLANSDASYKRLGDIVNRARMSGIIDWEHITDRTRNLKKNPHWGDAGALLRSAAQSWGQDLWADQPFRVEVWVEKEALAGVVERVANRLDCPWFACRGYVSQSEQWAASQRIKGYMNSGQAVVILHLGDHDPSGIDMTRDIRERITTFLVHDLATEHGLWSAGRVNHLDVWDFLTRRDEWKGAPLGSYVTHDEVRYQPFTVHRIALNEDQVEQYNPPPNPAKLTDSRSRDYVERFGDESWELDALDPATLDALIEDHVQELIDFNLFDAARERQEAVREDIRTLSRRDWDEVREFVSS